MTSSNIEQLASALLAVRREQRPCDPAPFTNALRGADEAYAVQELMARALTPQQQGVARYWKTGGRGRDGLFPHAPLPALACGAARPARAPGISISARSKRKSRSGLAAPSRLRKLRR